MVTIKSHHCPSTHWDEPSWCSITAKGRRSRLRRCAPRRARTRPCACKVSRTQVAARKPCSDQLLPEVPGREVPIPGVEQLQHRHHRYKPPARRPAQAAVIKTLRARSLNRSRQRRKARLRIGKAQYRRRFMLAQPPRRRAFVNLLELHQSQSLFVLSAASKSSLWRPSKSGQIIWYMDRSHVTRLNPPLGQLPQVGLDRKQHPPLCKAKEISDEKARHDPVAH